MKHNKRIDSVKMMREIRDKHHELYSIHPELRKKRLLEIKKKYSALIRRRELIDN